MTANSVLELYRKLADIDRDPMESIDPEDVFNTCERVDVDVATLPSVVDDDDDGDWDYALNTCECGCESDEEHAERLFETAAGWR